MTTTDIQIIAFLLNRLPMTPPELAWAQDFIKRLEAMIAAAQTPAAE
jgi:hypothetical protein